MKKARLIPFLVIMLSFVLCSSRPFADAREIKIGVLAKRGTEICLKKWVPTAEYLSNKIPGYEFTIVPLSFDQIYSWVRDEKGDFIITNPSFYVELEYWYGINRIATLKNLRLGQPFTEFGGVIFCRSDRTDIRHLKDLKGKTFMAVKETSFGGWRMAWREMKEKGIDPYKDFAKLEFGGTHDAVVYAVRDGKVDAGTVRTDTLERMASEGKIKLGDFYVIHEHGGGEVHLPFLHSTRAYPEWPFAKLRHTPDKLAEEVCIALLEMPPDCEAAIAAKCAGWTIPLNYQSVHDCLKYLRLGPYRDFGKITIGDVIRKYWLDLVIAGFLFLGLFVSLIFILRLNRNIQKAHEKLQAEVEVRKKTEKRLRESKDKFELLVKSLPSPVYKGQVDWTVDFLDEKVEKLTGYPLLDFITRRRRWCDVVHPEDIELVKKNFIQALKTNKSYFRTYRIKTSEGEIRWVEDRGQIICDNNDEVIHIIGVFNDITEQKLADEEKRAMEAQLYQSEKLASVGQLSAGIAHEINTPTQFVGDNVLFLRESFEDIARVIDTYTKLLEVNKEKETNTEITKKLDEIIEEVDLEYLMEEIPKAIEQSLEGVERIATIVRSMKKFAHPGTEEMVPSDINEAIKNTIIVCRNEWKYVSEVITDLDESLPPVPCKIAEINQVILNMVVNAAHAIEEVLGENPQKKGTITIKTRKNDKYAEIIISDTGKGIPEDLRSKIFDPFFTTKDVGKGTGMGLNLAHNIISEHGGTINVESEVGAGTTFTIRLPLDNVQGSKESKEEMFY